MKKKIIKGIIITGVIALGCFAYYSFTHINPNPRYMVGQKLDSLDGVYVYYNGGVGNVEERNLAADGYNLGLKYQCVEFVKRYYYQHYQHKMPDTYGHAKDFFDRSLADGALNKQRALRQFTNPGKTKPRTGDLLVFAGHAGNSYGHVAIVSDVYDGEIEVIQQNPGPFAESRIRLGLTVDDGLYYVQHERLFGWLRIK